MCYQGQTTFEEHECPVGFFCPEGTGDVYEVDGLLPNGDPNYKFLCPPGFSCKDGIKPRVNFVAYIIWVQKLLLRVKANFAFSCKKLYMIYTVYLLIFVVVHFSSQLDCSQSQRSIFDVFSSLICCCGR